MSSSGTFIEMLLIVPDDNSTAVTHARQPRRRADPGRRHPHGRPARQGHRRGRGHRGGCGRPGPSDVYITDSGADIGAIPSPSRTGPHRTSGCATSAPADGDDPERRTPGADHRSAELHVRQRPQPRDRRGRRRRLHRRGVPLRPRHRHDLADALHVDGHPGDRSSRSRPAARSASGRSSGPQPCSATSACLRSSRHGRSRGHRHAHRSGPARPARPLRQQRRAAQREPADVGARRQDEGLDDHPRRP